MAVTAAEVVAGITVEEEAHRMVVAEEAATQAAVDTVKN